jgi:hypothetical protein
MPPSRGDEASNGGVIMLPPIASRRGNSSREISTGATEAYEYVWRTDSGIDCGGHSGDQGEQGQLISTERVDMASQGRKEESLI